MQKYKLNGQWVSGAVRQAATLKKQELGKVKKETKTETKKDVKTEDIRDLRAKYKEAHPEGKGVAVKFINDSDYIKQKIEEFTK